MNDGRTIFSQLISFLPDREFRRCVARYRGDSRLRGLSCWEQFLAMAFAQLTYRESLRDIEACLRALGAKRYHLGFRRMVARSTLADANEAHDWRIFADFAQILIGIARPLYASDAMGVELDRSLYALDSTTIDLCLSLFPWAKFHKPHRASVSTFMSCTPGEGFNHRAANSIPSSPSARSSLRWWSRRSRWPTCRSSNRPSTPACSPESA